MPRPFHRLPRFPRRASRRASGAASPGDATASAATPCLSLCRIERGASYLDAVGADGHAFPDAAGFVVGRLARPLRIGGQAVPGVVVWLDSYAG